MKKILSFTVLLSILASSPMAQAQDQQVVDPLFVLFDVVLYRPAGVVVTALGTAAFAGISPLVALASIPKPHDAFQKTASILVLAPAAYTFLRPVGEKSLPYNEPADRYASETTEVAKPTLAPVAVPVPVVPAPVAPVVKPEVVKPATGSGL